jgi:ABC-2 type transport system permease protein
VPIHDQGYRRYGGDRTRREPAWAVIARAGLRARLGQRSFVALLILSWLPFVVRVVQLYAAANVPQAAFLAPTPQMFRQFLDQQEVFVFFLTVYAGAGLIANDRRAHALQIYLSKPMTRFEYVAGKLVILMSWLAFITWVPATLLLVVQVAFAGNVEFFTSNLYLFPAITVFSAIEVVTIATVMLALSSLSNSARYVGILYAALLFFSQALFGVLQVVTASSSLSWVSLTHDLNQVGDAVFRLPLRDETPWLLSLAVLLVLVAAAGFVLERRVRGVEVIA